VDGDRVAATEAFASFNNQTAAFERGDSGAKDDAKRLSVSGSSEHEFFAQPGNARNEQQRLRN